LRAFDVLEKVILYRLSAYFLTFKQEGDMSKRVLPLIRSKLTDQWVKDLTENISDGPLLNGVKLAESK
jgi:hypothetical protein